MNILRIAGCLNSFIAPTNFRVPPQVASGCCIRVAQDSQNIAAVPPSSFAAFGITCENMDTTSVDMVNGGSRLEEGIDRCAPVLHQSFYKKVSRFLKGHSCTLTEFIISTLFWL